MLFIPASQPSSASTPRAWCFFAFIGRELLLPTETDSTLQPLDPAALMDAASSRHYLGTLAAVDCWALVLPLPLPG